MRYLADDGKIFDNKKECMEYEETLGIFLDINGDVCSITDDVFFVHTDYYLSDLGVDKGNWVWDESLEEWKNLNAYIEFLQGISNYFKSKARQKYLALGRALYGQKGASFLSIGKLHKIFAAILCILPLYIIP